MPEPLPSPVVQPDEPISRHCIRRSEHMRPGLRKGRYKLFLPFPYAELSVARTHGMSAAQIRQIGIDHVDPLVKGHATVDAAAILREGLAFDANGHPYPQHADVVGWSGDEAQDRTIAQVLAEASTLVEYEAAAL
jgi:hypothetical protein